MKNLSIVGPLPNPIDGCSFANHVFCKNLKKNNVKYNVINTNTKVVSSQQGTRFSLKKALLFLKVYLEVFNVIKSDVVYVTPGQTFFGLLKYSPFFIVCQLFKIPYVIHVHGNHLGTEYKNLKGIKKKLFYYFVSSAKAGIVLSKSLVNIFDGLLPPNQVYIVENFAPNELYANYKPELKQKNKLVISFLSNLIAEKGILDVLDALIVLKKRGVVFEANLAGKVEDEFKSIIDDKIAAIGTSVRYLGIVKGEDKLNLLTRSNVFILPTYYKMEGQPISILEALATGNIIVTTKHAGIPDIISVKNGFFVKKKAPEELANLLEVLATNIEVELKSKQAFNIKYARERFTEDKFCNSILDILRKIA